MTEERIEGAGQNFGGRLQQGFGRLIGDEKMQLEGGLRRAGGVALDYYGRAVNKLETQVERVPESVRPHARKALGVARDKPVATMLGIAAVTFLLTRRRRR